MTPMLFSESDCESDCFVNALQTVVNASVRGEPMFPSTSVAVTLTTVSKHDWQNGTEADDC